MNLELQGRSSYPRDMTELDQVWAGMLAAAEKNASELGREDIAAYLRLKATNDAIRARGVEWLFDTMIEIASNAQLRHAMITIEREEPHRFTRGNSRMVGSKLEIRHGVRCLTVEAGWTRAPSDGVMHGAALAYARVLHFGLQRHAAELKLIHGNELPRWVAETGDTVDSGELERHFDLFIGG
jgi:hypothetical protein